MILRVPGIGVKSALRIVKLRRYGNLSFEDVRRVGIVMKRARYFMTVNGRYYGGISLDSQQLRSRLISRTAVREVREMSLLIPRVEEGIPCISFMTEPMWAF